MIAIIGGSGLSTLAPLQVTDEKRVPTPYGEPSAALTFGTLNGRAVVFLARHGHGHTIAPHAVNYRANIWALRECGVRTLIAVASVGGIGEHFPPGTILVPDQMIDYTWGRESTFFQGPDAPVTHIDFTEPYSERVRKLLLAAARTCAEPARDGGTYGATQGPRLETAAEIDRLERDGCDVVGMTGMPEAALAREAGLEYAALNVVANYAAGRGDSRRRISLPEIAGVLERAMGRVRRIIEASATSEGES